MTEQTRARTTMVSFSLKGFAATIGAEDQKRKCDVDRHHAENEKLERTVHPTLRIRTLIVFFLTLLLRSPAWNPLGQKFPQGC
jgi:hypothetical protein